jgi:hypothetical protein
MDLIEEVANTTDNFDAREPYPVRERQNRRRNKLWCGYPIRKSGGCGGVVIWTYHHASMG